MARNPAFPKMRHGRDLPNEDGYRFVAVTKNGLSVPCTVARHPETGMHYIKEILYADLKGWYTVEEARLWRLI